MIRSICLISREYPPETAFGGIARVAEMTARGLVDEGVAVHVISLARAGAGSRELQDGVVVHRIPAPSSGIAGSPELEQSLWAATVAAFYASLDELVEFDAILAPEYYAEALKVAPGPHTVLALALHTSRALISPDALDVVEHPSEVIAAEMEHAAMRRADLLVAPTSLLAEHAGAVASTPVALVPFAFDASRCLRQGTPLEAHEFELVFVGRL